MPEKESEIKFLEEKDLSRIRAIPNYSQISLERGYILYRVGRPSEFCEIIIKNPNARYKIKAGVGHAMTPDGMRILPSSIQFNRRYSGSLAFGSLENRIISQLRELYNADTISAVQYDSFTGLVSTSKEDIMHGHGQYLGMYLALASSLISGYLTSGDFGSMLLYTGLSGATGTLITAAVKRHTKRSIEDKVNSLLAR